MQPDILAKPSERVPSGPARDAGKDQPVHNPVVESMSASAPSVPARVSPPAPVRNGQATEPLHRGPVHGQATGLTNGHSNGHANGHSNGHANGHSNGRSNGHALHGYATMALVAPVDTAVVHAPAVHATEFGFYLRFGKRAIDVIGALGALVLSAPVLAFAALLIKLESRGPIVYRSTRIGKNGRPFTFFKLRSMVNEAEQIRHRVAHLNECDGPVFKISRDPRVTRIGRFLRSTSIDEIPQFMNVLRGEMSLVGPRPPIPEEVARYEPWQMHRLDVAPGITCLWQISGRSRIGFQEWMRLDLEYIRNRSFAMDLKILLRTIPAVLSREGAY